eukprot:SAG22_NODE_1183_length_5231_cov_6.467069_8_plen_35_part_01
MRLLHVLHAGAASGSSGLFPSDGIAACDWVPRSAI